MPPRSEGKSEDATYIPINRVTLLALLQEIVREGVPAAWVKPAGDMIEAIETVVEPCLRFATVGRAYERGLADGRASATEDEVRARVDRELRDHLVTIANDMRETLRWIAQRTAGATDTYARRIHEAAADAVRRCTNGDPDEIEASLRPSDARDKTSAPELDCSTKGPMGDGEPPEPANGPDEGASVSSPLYIRDPKGTGMLYESRCPADARGTGAKLIKPSDDPKTTAQLTAILAIRKAQEEERRTEATGRRPPAVPPRPLPPPVPYTAERYRAYEAALSEWESTYGRRRNDATDKPAAPIGDALEAKLWLLEWLGGDVSEATIDEMAEELACIIEDSPCGTCDATGAPRGESPTERATDETYGLVIGLHAWLKGIDTCRDCDGKRPGRERPIEHEDGCALGAILSEAKAWIDAEWTKRFGPLSSDSSSDGEKP